MGNIVIRKDGLEIIVEDLSDLRAVIEIVSQRQLAMPIPQAPTPTPHNPPAVVGQPTPDAFRRFYRETVTKERQKLIVQETFRHDNGISDADLRRLLHLQTNLEVAGIITGIRKAERRSGLPDSAAITRERRGSVGNFVYRYRMSPACRAALQGMVPERLNGETAA